MLKSNIPVANIRFFDKTPTVADLERRFARFLRGFRERRCVAQQIERVAEGGPKENFDLYGNSLSTKDKIKIERRALRYVERQEAAAGSSDRYRNLRPAGSDRYSSPLSQLAAARYHQMIPAAGLPKMPLSRQCSALTSSRGVQNRRGHRRW